MAITVTRTQPQRRIAALAHPRPDWSDGQRRAWETAKAACDAFLACMNYFSGPMGNIEMSAYQLWQDVERAVAPLFEGEE